MRVRVGETKTQHFACVVTALLYHETTTLPFACDKDTALCVCFHCLPSPRDTDAAVMLEAESKRRSTLSPLLHAIFQLRMWSFRLHISGWPLHGMAPDDRCVRTIVAPRTSLKKTKSGSKADLQGCFKMVVC